MTKWSQYFQLKDPNRGSFELNPDTDFNIFVDLDGIRPRLQRVGLTAETFKLVIEGDFGAGKSHLLRYIQHHPPVEQHHPFYVKLGGFDRKTAFIQVYRQIMTELLPLLEKKETGPIDLSTLSPNEFLDHDSCLALKELLSVRILSEHPERVLARRWLRADPDLRSSESVKGGYARRLVNSTPAQLMHLLLGISALYKRSKHHTLLMLLDESESFSRLTDDVSQADVAAGLRELFDPSNTALSVVVGLNTPSSRAGHHPMLRSEVRSRMVGKYIQLKPIESDKRVSEFIQQLWGELASNPETYPFHLSQQSLTLFIRGVTSWRKKLDVTLLEGQPVVPRDICSLLNILGQEALREGVKAPITVDKLTQWFGEI
ncbi:MAG: hypothetical protein ACKO6N_28645 [Myxococcota bacterium]